MDTNGREDVPDEDGSFHHPISLFGRDQCSREPPLQEAHCAYPHLRAPRQQACLSRAPLFKRRILISLNRTIERAHDLPMS